MANNDYLTVGPNDEFFVNKDNVRVSNAAGTSKFNIATETGNVTAAGTLEVTGASTLTGAVGITGAVTGTSVRGTTGIAGGYQAVTASGAVTISSGLVTLAKTDGAIAATIPATLMVPGSILYIVNTSASGTQAHTVTLHTTGTWDGTNRRATLNAPAEALLVICESTTRYRIIENYNSVGLGGV